MTDTTFDTPSSGGRDPTASSDDIRNAARDAGDAVRSAAEQTQSRLREKGDQKIDAASTSAGEQLRTVADQLRHAGDGLGEDQGWARQAFSQGADGLERVSSYLRDGRMDTFARDIQSFARTNPAAFLAGSVALGFIAARVAKTAAEHAAPSAQPTSTQLEPTYTPTTSGVDETRSFAPMGLPDQDPTMRDL
jgi:hypothetical protein